MTRKSRGSSKLTTDPPAPVKRGPGNPNWRKGVSGNPGGRHKDTERVRELAREKGPGVIEVLDEIAQDPEQPGRTRVAAGQVLLDHGIGRPATVVTDEYGEELRITVRTATGQDPFVKPTWVQPAASEIEKNPREIPGGNGEIA